MGIYLKLFFAGFLTKSFWADRIETFREMVRHPADYFSNLNKKENIEDAYLLGMSSTFFTFAGLALIYILTFGLFTLGAGLIYLPVLLAVEFVCWIAGQYLLYHLGAWAFALALKWLTGKYEIEKIRPILFSIGISGVVSVIPGFGSLLSFLVFIVLLVIAYENAFKVERGPAIGSAVLGTLMLGVAMGLPFWLIGFLFSALWTGTAGLAGLGLMATLLHHQPSFDKDQAKNIATLQATLTYSPANQQTILTTPTPPPAQAVLPSPTPLPVSTPVMKKKKKKPATVAPSDQAQGETKAGVSTASIDAAPSSAPQPTPTHVDAVGKAIGDAAGDAAKKIFGF
jgi:hypothetical protein